MNLNHFKYKSFANDLHGWCDARHTTPLPEGTSGKQCQAAPVENLSLSERQNFLKPNAVAKVALLSIIQNLESKAVTLKEFWFKS